MRKGTSASLGCRWSGGAVGVEAEGYSGKVYDELDAEFVRMRRIAIWEAQEVG
jgi:hypothetical protein